MSIIKFLKEHIFSISPIMGVSSNGTFASSTDPMQKVLR